MTSDWFYHDNYFILIRKIIFDQTKSAEYQNKSSLYLKTFRTLNPPHQNDWNEKNITKSALNKDPSNKLENKVRVFLDFSKYLQYTETVSFCAKWNWFTKGGLILQNWWFKIWQTKTEESAVQITTTKTPQWEVNVRRKTNLTYCSLIITKKQYQEVPFFLLEYIILTSLSLKKFWIEAVEKDNNEIWLQYDTLYTEDAYIISIMLFE